MSIFHHLPNRARGLEILPCLKYYNVLKQENSLTLAQCCQKYWLYEKKVQVKVVENSIFYEKLWVHMSISLQSGTKGFKRLPYLKYYNVLK